MEVFGRATHQEQARAHIQTHEFRPYMEVSNLQRNAKQEIYESMPRAPSTRGEIMTFTEVVSLNCFFSSTRAVENCSFALLPTVCDVLKLVEKKHNIDVSHTTRGRFWLCLFSSSRIMCYQFRRRKKERRTQNGKRVCETYRHDGAIEVNH
jgi:hypothetical protein